MSRAWLSAMPDFFYRDAGCLRFTCLASVETMTGQALVEGSIWLGTHGSSLRSCRAQGVVPSRSYMLPDLSGVHTRCGA